MNEDSTLNIAYFEEWRDCKSGQTAELAIDVSLQDAMLTAFKGISNESARRTKMPRCHFQILLIILMVK